VPHMSRSVCRWPTTAEGHEDQFLVPGTSPRYGFRKETIAGTHGNEQDAPIAAVGLLVITGQRDPNRPLRATRLNKFMVGSERSFAEPVVRGAPRWSHEVGPEGRHSTLRRRPKSATTLTERGAGAARRADVG
jgi:hypothetical protein